MDKPCDHSDAFWCSMYWKQDMLCPHCPLLYNRSDIAEAREALDDYKRNGGMTVEELRRELKLEN